MVDIPRVVPRSLRELEGAAGIYSDTMLEDAFANRGTRTTMQWVSQVTEGLKTPFNMVTSDEIESEQLSSVYDLSMRVNELKNFVFQNGLQGLFMIHQISEDGTTREEGADPINVLDHYGTVTLEQVQKSTQWTKEYGQDHLVWGETLMQRLIEALCEAGLRERVSERLMGMNPYQL